MSPLSTRPRRLRTATLALSLIALAAALYYRSTLRSPCPPTPIYQGVTYRCDPMPETPESGGLVHVVEVDLTAPGIQLYVTNIDPVAKAHGWEYTLDYVGRVTKEKHLAVCVNGTLFKSNSGWIRMRGDEATSLETAVSEHLVNHLDPNSPMLWFEDNLTPHMAQDRPAKPELLAKMRFGIGGQEGILQHGLPRPETQTIPDHRTMLAVDTARKRLWIAAFDKASYRMAARKLGQLGAQDGTMLDGGTSTAMALGQDAANVSPGVLIGNWRPVPVHFGIKAVPLK